MKYLTKKKNKPILQYNSHKFSNIFYEQFTFTSLKCCCYLIQFKGFIKINYNLMAELA